MTTTDRFRADIDSGRTGDKVAARDPAAAPLGTDDEAAGAPPKPEDIALARIQELKYENRQGDDNKVGSALVYMMIVCAVMITLTGALLYFIGVR
jgi:hypothetical protein